MNHLSHGYACDIMEYESFIPRLCMEYEYLSHDYAWDIAFIPRLCMGYDICPTTMHVTSYLSNDYAWDMSHLSHDPTTMHGI